MFPKRLSDGYQAFLEGRFHNERARYEQLGETGQSPEILLIGCCDSRVSPEVIFDAGPGEMFVIRNVANLVPPYEGEAESSSYHGTSAAIEFAVNALEVKHIVVLGHASCGGVRAVFDDAEPLTKIDFVGKWMSQITPVSENLPRTGDRATDIQRLEWAVVGHSLANLMTFPSIRARVQQGKLELHGAYFGVATGLLFLRDPATGEFSPCQAQPAA
ncbi:carbonic anhydrase [Bordetella petrii]|uniref:carbonic anhydrase n=1 Tax=Bordetella petrii TaxID=94624 RepID=UPI003731ABAE